jgi:hypothetical protein
MNIDDLLSGQIEDQQPTTAAPGWLEDAIQQDRRRDADLAQTIFQQGISPDSMNSPLMREKVDVSKYMASRFNLDPGYVLQNYDQFYPQYQAQKAELSDKGDGKAIMDEATVGKAYVDISALNYRVMNIRNYITQSDKLVTAGPIDATYDARFAADWPKRRAELEQQIKDTEAQIQQANAVIPAYQDDRTRQWYVEALKTVTRQGPGLVDAVGKAAIGAGAAALTGGLGALASGAGVAGSLAVAGTFAGWGMNAGMLMANAEQTGGQIYGDLIDAGVDHDNARLGASLGIAITSPLAIAQVNLATKALGGPLEGVIGKTVQSAIVKAAGETGAQFATKRTAGALAAKIALDYTGRVAGQELISVAQSVATDLSFNFGAHLENELNAQNIPLRTGSEIVSRAIDAMKESLLTMALMELPVTGMGAVRGARELKAGSKAVETIQKVPQADIGIVRTIALDEASKGKAGDATARQAEFAARQADPETRTAAIDEYGAPLAVFHATRTSDGLIHFDTSPDVAASRADGRIVGIDRQEFLGAVEEKYGRPAAEYIEAVAEGRIKKLTPAIGKAMPEPVRAQIQEALPYVQAGFEPKTVPDSVHETIASLGLSAPEQHIIPAHLDVEATDIATAVTAQEAKAILDAGEARAVRIGSTGEWVIKDAETAVPLSPIPVKEFRIPKENGRIKAEDTGIGYHAIDPQTGERVASIEYHTGDDGKVITKLPDNPRQAAELLTDFRAKNGRAVLDVPVEVRDQIARQNPDRAPAAEILNSLSRELSDLAERMDNLTDDPATITAHHAQARSLYERMESASRELADIDAEFLGEDIPEPASSTVEDASVAVRKRQELAVESLGELRDQIREYAPNIPENEVDAALSVAEMRAHAMGMGVDSWIRQSIEGIAELETPTDMLRAPRGGVSFLKNIASEGKAIIHMSEASDATTLVHELGHIIRRQLPDSDQLKLLEHYGEKTWNVSAEEKFAADWERYFHQGEAPKPELQGLFAKIRHFFGRIYNNISQTLHPEVKNVIDRALTDSGETVLAQPAWHGTPHNFDRFTTEKMGTGEGAQAYGWGLYFAGKQDVADWYRQKLSKKDYPSLREELADIKVDGQPIFEKYPALDGKLGGIFAERVKLGRLDGIVKHLKELASNEEGSVSQEARDLANSIESGSEIKYETGKLYKVEIPEDNKLLDWDNRIENMDSDTKWLVKTLKENLDVDFEEGPTPERNDYYPQDYYVTFKSPINGVNIFGHGKTIEEAKSYAIGRLTGEQAYHILESISGSDRLASKYLAKNGIPGIRFLDGSSRGAGFGTSNYVIFDDADVSITEKLYQPEKTLKSDDSRSTFERAGVDYDTTERTDNRDIQEAGGSPAQRTAPEEAAEQVRTLDRGRIPEQTVVTIKDAQDWLEANGFPRIAKEEGATALIDRLMENEAFKKLNVFDQTRVASQLERPLRERDYNQNTVPTTNKKSDGQQAGNIRNGANEKTEGSGILTSDTIRGCDHYCFECYALKGTAIPNISHQHPVFQHLSGTIKSGEVLRIGTVGDPSRDWSWTHEQVKGIIERSQAKDKGITADGNVYYITKLLNLKGFNPETAKNLQVTLDPLMPAHMWTAMENIIRLKSAYHETNISVRIRSVASLHPDLQNATQAAVEFANRYNLPVIETRMRFTRNNSMELLMLDKSKYKREGNQYKLKDGELDGKADQNLVCDKKGLGCPGCGGCRESVTSRVKNVEKQAKALKATGADGVSLVEQAPVFDPTGGSTLFQPANTDTPEFRAWFGDSKVVDNKGNPLRVYHGTANDFDAFASSSVGKTYEATPPGEAYYFTTDAGIANNAAIDSSWNTGMRGKETRIIPSYVSLQHPLEITLRREDGEYPENYIDHRPYLVEASKSEYDGIIIKAEDRTLVIAFKPEQIKSINNKGQWNPEDPRLLYQLDKSDAATLMGIIDQIGTLEADYQKKKAMLALTPEDEAKYREQKTELQKQRDDWREAKKAAVMADVKDQITLPIKVIEEYQGEAWADEELEYLRAMYGDDVTPWADDEPVGRDGEFSDEIYAEDMANYGEESDHGDAVSEPKKTPSRAQANADWIAKVQTEGESMMAQIRGVYRNRDLLENAETGHFLEISWGGPILKAIYVSDSRPETLARAMKAAVAHLASNGDRYREAWARFDQDYDAIAQAREIDRVEPLEDRSAEIERQKNMSAEERISVIRDIIKTGLRDKTNAEAEAAYQQVSSELAKVTRANTKQMAAVKELDNRVHSMQSAYQKTLAKTAHIERQLGLAERQNARDETTITKLKADKESLRKKAREQVASVVEKMQAEIKELNYQKRWALAESRLSEDILTGKHQAKVEELKGDYAALQAEYDHLQKELRMNVQWYKAEATTAMEAYKTKIQERDRLRRMKEYKQSLMDKIMKKTPQNIDFFWGELIRNIQGAYANDTFGKKRGAYREQLKAMIEQNPDALAGLTERDRDILLKKTIDQLTVADMERLAIQIDHLKKLGKAAWEEKRAAFRAEADALAYSLAESTLTGTPREYTEALPAERPDASRTKTLSDLIQEGITPQRLMDKLDGGMDYKGTWMQKVWNRVSDTWAESSRMTRERIDGYRAQLEQMGFDRTKANAIHVSIDDGREFTLQEAIGVYMARQNERAREALDYGHKLSQADIEKIIGSLSDKDKAVGDWIIEHGYGDRTEALRKATIDYTDKDLGLEERYSPIRRYESDGLSLAAQMEEDLMRSVPTRRTSVARGMTKARIDIPEKYQKPFRLDALSVFEEEVGKQEHFINLGMTTKLLKKAFSDQNLRSVVSALYGTSTMKQVDEWLNRVANPDIFSAQSSADRMARMLRSNAALAYLGYNQVTAIKAVVTGVLYSMGEAPLRVIKEQAQSLWIPHLVANYRKMCSLAPEMKDRTISRAHAELTKSNAKRFVKLHGFNQKYAYIALTWGQRYTDTVCWTATYDKYRADGLDEKAAAREATNFILRTQPVGDSKDVSAMLARKDFSSVFTQFAGQGNQIWNELAPARAIQTFRNPKIPAAVKAKAAAKFGILMAGATTGAAIYSLFGMRGIPQTEEEWQQFKQQAVIGGSVTTIPWLGSTASALLSGFAPETSVTTPVSGYVKFGQGVAGIIQGLAEGKEPTEKKIKNTAYALWEGTAVAVGLPYLGPKRIVDMATDEQTWQDAGADWWKPWVQYMIIGGPSRN